MSGTDLVVSESIEEIQALSAVQSSDYWEGSPLPPCNGNTPSISPSVKVFRHRLLRQSLRTRCLVASSMPSHQTNATHCEAVTTLSRTACDRFLITQWRSPCPSVT